MQFIEGKNRNQSLLFPQSLDQIISSDNEVRIIDLFVESIKLEDFKFVIKTTTEGRPAYHPKDLLKIFVYDYLNHITEIHTRTTRSGITPWLSIIKPMPAFSAR